MAYYPNGLMMKTIKSSFRVRKPLQSSTGTNSVRTISSPLKKYIVNSIMCKRNTSIGVLLYLAGSNLLLVLAGKGALAGNCETLPSTVHITKEEYSEGGILSRTCEGDVGVAKCEGSCSSQVQPSVVHPSGFLKECMCCRESFLRERVVTLTHCYDGNGGRINGRQGTMDVKLREPADCKCFRCGESSD